MEERETGDMSSDPAVEDVALAQRLYEEWRAGKPKSRIERETWNDGRSPWAPFRPVHLSNARTPYGKEDRSSPIALVTLRGKSDHSAMCPSVCWRSRGSDS